MLPAPLAPIDSAKTRALTTIYAPRRQNTRKNKTAQNRMLEKPIKSNLSPFHPLPSIGKTLQSKVIVLDLNNDSRPFREVLQPLTPLSVDGYRNPEQRKSQTPQHLIRENTYDVIEPIYINPSKIKSITQKTDQQHVQKVSPKTRFKNAALQVAKLNAVADTGKLLCLRERETYSICYKDDNRLQKLPQSTPHQLNKLTEMFQSLDFRGRKDRMKKENNWF
ncbi:unnamed protein product [Leptidea sinapis]|uniref:Uncharacterized protein n=1 Tax=Leptidea sinapis TaxID=189913 RepID=A0A5E4QZJ7_9NEOP|nr:unnamed protein product [Leptidea sinapis]